jgi:hypothetical protein
MDSSEKRVIEELFDKLAAVEDRCGGRDGEAEAHITARVARQPAAPYYMAQTILYQEQALAIAEARIDELERQLSERSGGGFLGSLFGGSLFEAAAASRPAAIGRERLDPGVAAYADPRYRQGGGFLAGAAQTALGVVGGVLLGSALSGMFRPEAEVAADSLLSEPAEDDDEPAEAEPAADPATGDEPA